MCVKAKCDIVSHTSKPKISVNKFGGSDPQVFIQVLSSGGRATPPAVVYLTPCIPGAAFAGKLGDYLLQERTVDQWTSLFMTLAVTLDATSEETEMIAEKFDEPLPPLVFTPQASKLGKWKAASPELDLDTEFTLVKSKFDFKVPKLLPPGMLDKTVSSAAKFGGLLSPLWSGLTGNVEVLLYLVTLVYTKESKSHKKAMEQIDDVTVATSLIATKLGGNDWSCLVLKPSTPC
jgi:hypothetical protein